MKKLIYLYFFGYLKLKWRRLVRSLLFVTVTLLIIVNSEKVEILVGWLIGISLLSYVVKPFVIEEKP